MNSFTLKIFLSVFLITSIQANAATLVLDAPSTAPSNRKPVTIRVYIDPEGVSLSAISGTLSFPSELFDVEGITTQSSIVSIWTTRPQVSSERYFDSRTRINFEGIMPGGFVGVRSPYYGGVKPGVVFTVTLLPKTNGVGSLLLDNIELHAYDSEGTKLPTESFSTNITVPELTSVMKKTEIIPHKIISSTLKANLARDPLIANNSWYLTVLEDESVRPINHIEVTENGEYNGDKVPSYQWKVTTNPYVLLYQSRVKYVHVKVFYENNTYATQTIPPVENSSAFQYISIILIGVVVILLVLYLHGKNFKIFSF